MQTSTRERERSSLCIHLSRTIQYVLSSNSIQKKSHRQNCNISIKTHIQTDFLILPSETHGCQHRGTKTLHLPARRPMKKTKVHIPFYFKRSSKSSASSDQYNNLKSVVKADLYISFVYGQSTSC